MSSNAILIVICGYTAVLISLYLEYRHRKRGAR